MYNRYVPQQDGTYQKNRIRQAPEPPPSEIPSHPQQEDLKECSRPESAGNFLRQLLPKNMDTNDLLIVVLMLLLAGDCEENKNTWLLTLALYLLL